MDVKKHKELNKFLLEHSFNEMLRARKELDFLSKEAAIFFIGVFTFLCSFLFNLSASIIYDLIKESLGWKIVILVATSISLILLIWLIQKYIITPIKKQREDLLKYRDETHSALDRVIEDVDKHDRD